jgi:hypothetical protein
MGAFPGQGLVDIEDSTFADNSAIGGAGANGGGGSGGAIFNLDGSLILNSVTVAHNTVQGGQPDPGGTVGAADGAGVYSLAFGNTIDAGAPVSATLILDNSILGDNTGGADLASNAINGKQTNSASLVGRANLVQSNDLTNITNLGGVITVVADPNLGELANNGGLTQTIAITQSSPAFAAGNASIPPALGSAPTADQRGFARVVNGQMDLGAFEVQAAVPAVSPVTVAFSPGSQTVTLSANLAASSGPVNEGHVAFTVANQTAAASVSGGTASVMIALPAGLAPGAYTIGVAYTDGSPDLGKFRSGVGAGTLTVNPPPSPPPPVLTLPPSVSVAIGPSGEVWEVVNSAGVLTQFDASGAHMIGGGARAASVAFVRGSEVLLVTMQNGALVQSDASGVHVLATAGVQDASVAIGPSGAVYEVVNTAGLLTQFDASGAHTIGGGAAAASVAFGPSGEVVLVTTQARALFQSDSSGVHELASGGVRGAAAAFAPFGEIADLIFQDESLLQFDAFGAHRIGTIG